MESLLPAPFCIDLQLSFFILHRSIEQSPGRIYARALLVVASSLMNLSVL